MECTFGAPINQRFPSSFLSLAIVGKPFSLLDTRVVYCGDNLKSQHQLHPSRDGARRMQKSFFISFAYSQDAITECQNFFKRTGKVIIPLTVREILDEQIARKLV